MLQQLLRAQFALLCVLTTGWAALAQCEDPIEFNADLSPYSVECLSELPTECDETVTANRGETACIYAEQRQVDNTCTATTALGTGEDGAIVLFDVNGDPNDDRYFAPTSEGLTLTQFDNGVAQVSGQVADIDNPNAILNIQIVYDQGVSGADWAGGFKHDMSCTPTSAITDAWSIYILNPGLSYFLGAGDLDGTLLTLNHAPSSEYFGFQIGEMANDRNCNYGAGGWFSYEGTLNGVSIQGAQGDVLLDLECAPQIVDPCGEDESSVTLIYTAIDEDCADALTVEQVITRDDTEAPTFVDAPDSLTVACADGLPEVPTVTATDNCVDSDPEGPSVTYNGQTPPYDELCTGSYKVDRTWIAQDCSGNQSTHTQTITVVDEVAPVISGGEGYLAECDGEGNAQELGDWLAIQGGATATDDCGTVAWSHDYEDGDLSDLCGATGSVDVTFSAADDCGNTSTLTLTFTIQDTEAPTLTAAAMAEVPCETYSAEGIYEASASDMCGEATVVLVSVNQVSNSCAGQYLHTYKAVDDCSNESETYQQVVTLIDETAPEVTITCPADVDLLADGACSADTSAAATGEATFTATDNCDDALINTLSHADSVEHICEGTMIITRTWTIESKDHCGLISTASCEQTITVTDDTDPSIDIPAANLTVECDGAGNSQALADWVADHGGAEASDNCSAVTWSHSDATLSDLCGATGAVTVTFTATDDCGNSSTTTATFTIEDTTKPSIDVEAGDQTVECDGAGNEAALDAWLTSYAGASASDLCGGVTWSDDFEGLSDDCGETGSATVTFTATDDCGNTSTTTATFTIEDTTAPTWNAFETYVNAACEDLLYPEDPTLVPISASDICAGVVYSIEAYQLSGGCPGTWMRIWTATDSCGNASEEVEQYVQLYDIIAPEPAIVCPDDYTVDADALCEADLSTAAAGMATASATDNCDDDVQIVITHSDGEATSLCEGQFSFTRTFTATATDDCDNVASVSCDQLITVEDNTPPSIDTLAMDLTVECDGAGNAEDLAAWLTDHGGASASDNCSDIVWTHSDSTLSDLCAATGSTTVTFTATDACGNQSTTTATFTIEDTTAPAFSGDVEVSISCDEWNCDAAALEALGIFTIEEACGTYTVEASCVSFSGGCVTPVGAYQANYTATDECGNTSSFSQIVILSDDIKPVPSISCPADTSLVADAECEVDLNPLKTGMATGTATDNCDDAPHVEVDYLDGPITEGCAGSYSFIRTFTATATDHCWNVDSISCEQLITVNDETAPDAPVIDGPEDAEVHLDADCATDASPAVTGQATATAHDNCDENPSIDISHEDSAPTYTCTGDDQAQGSYTFTRTWTAVATDACGNEGSASTYVQTITVSDTLAPDFEGSAHQFSIACDLYDEDALYDVVASDNCDSDVTITILSNSQTSGSCGGAYLRTYEATDDCGNSTQFEQAISLIDTVAPALTIMCPADAVLEADANCNADTSMTALGNAMYTATDLCDHELELSLTHADVVTEGCAGSYSAVRTFTLTAQDDCGNTTTVTCTQNITVNDVTDPTIDTAASNLTVECDGTGNGDDLNAWLASQGGAAASDNCSDVTWSHNYTECDGGLGMFTTFRQGDWGSSNANNPAASLLDSDFDAVFPDGVSVGCADGYELLFTTADAIDTYLPCTGGAEDLVLTHGGANPTEAAVDPTCWDNALVSHLLTAKLNVAFDAADEDFSASDVAVADLVIQEGPFAGLSIQEVIVISDGVLGDCRNDYTPQQCRVALRAFNKNYDDGTDNLGYMQIAGCFTDECASTGQAIVTFTATDDCGNSSETTATFTIEDTTAPEITADNEVEVPCDTYDAETPYEYAASDVCSGVTTTIEDLFFSGACEGTYQRTYTATDECGNSSSFVQIINLTDEEAPTFTIACPADTILSAGTDCSADTTAATHGLATFADVADNCDAEVEMNVSYSDSIATPCEGSRVITRTFTVTGEDNCMNVTTLTCTQTITVNDDTAPSITAPANAIVECDGMGNADQLAAFLAGATASDNCSDVTIEHDFTALSDSCGATGSATVTFTATDACGNASSATATFTIEDTTAPSIDTAASPLTVECDGMGNVQQYLAWQEDQAGAAASDACGGVTWSHEVIETVDDCGGTVAHSVVAFTATDDCGNTSTTTATFTIEDTTAPEITATDTVAVPCDAFDADLAYEYAATDGCSGVATAISNLFVAGDCEGHYERTYTATDSCGNSSSFVQIINLTDEEAPTFTIACPADTTLSAGTDCSADTTSATHGLATFADVADNCDAEVSMSVTYADSLATPCDGSRVITRTFTITGEDNCGNITTQTCAQTITVNDDTAPSITAPADAIVECDGMGNEDDLAAFLDGATATDNCSDVTIEHDFTALSDSCGATGGATVTFTATDACGNTSSATATFTIQDTTAPSLEIEGPAHQDLTQNAMCNIDTSVEALGTVTYTAEDDCGNASVEVIQQDGDALYTCAGDDDLLEGSYTFERTFTVTATDECGLTTTATYVQTITVTDSTAPNFTNTGGVENGAVQSVCCESHLGEVTIPDAVEPTYSDNCDTDVAYTMTETLSGAYAPTEDVDLFCLSSTPAAFADGETCNGYDPHSLRIFALPGGAEFYTAAGPGLVAHNADGTLTLTQSVVAADGSNAGWDITVTYGAALGWDDWSNQAFPTGYKRDCGDLIDDHVNWEYRILEFGSLSGTGDYAGSGLILSHAPSNNYYACQFGLGANNMNNEYGYSGWFTYSGEFMGNTIMGSGDLFGDLDCCLPWSIERDYAIVDDCGNANGFAYSVEVNGEDCEDAQEALVSGGQTNGHTPAVLGGAGEVSIGKTPIRVTNLQPNPTNDISQLGFVVDHNMRIRVDLVGMDGTLVAELYDGIAQTGVNHTLDVDAGSLNNGMYQIRLSSSAYLVVKKLLVSE